MLTHLRPQPKASSAAAAAVATDERRDASPSTACCISCFRLMSAPPESPPEGCGEADDSPEPELLCASCILHLAGKNKSPAVEAVGGAMSPLPKLSQLVKAEAKCQDQLQLLRGQQQVLQQQRESLQATKQAKEETIAAERELARQRRKHFLLIQERRKREDEIKFQQFQSEDHTGRSEQEAGADKPWQKKKQQQRPPKLAAPLQRRKSEPVSAAGLDAGDSIPSHIAEPVSKHSDTPHSCSDSNNGGESHSASLYERRRQMMACYSQDLSPLIDGRKPRRLPYPKPVAAMAVTKRRQALDNNAPTTTYHHSSGQQHIRKQGKGPAAAKTTRLHPLEEKKQYVKARPHQQYESNQFEDIHARANDEGGSKRASLQPPHHHASPLTAEIKPVSWAYELVNEVLPHDDDAGISGFSAPLHPVAEEESDAGPQFTMFPLKRQLPNRTIPPAQVKPPVEATVKTTRWEYSSERLSSLLEKYNVSVSAVATNAATKLPLFQSQTN